MKIYTKNGDTGKTSLMNGVSVSKSDDRIELLGTIDELSSHIGLAKVIASQPLQDRLSQIQKALIQMMAGIADPRNLDYRFTKEETFMLEEEIDRLEGLFPRAKEFVLMADVNCPQGWMLPGCCQKGRTPFPQSSPEYGADSKAMQYINRLSDYLYITARYADYKASAEPDEGLRQEVVKNVMKSLAK